jgi:hypothetical protein
MTRAKWIVMTAMLLTPALLGSSCSTNAVAESAATTFFDALASNIADLLFAQFSAEP